MLRFAGIFLLAFPGAAWGQTEAHTVTGERYRLYWEGPAEEAQEMSRVLEAAWGGFTAFFGESPRLKSGEVLEVRFYGSRESWAVAIRADGAAAPEGAGGYYHPANRRVYLYRQPTRYYTRCLLIHEAGHQFHYLGRTGNRNPSAGWYTEGVVEHLAWHWWDGETLRLGVVPLSLKDYPAAALKSLEAGETGLEALVEGKGDRPLGAMLVRYLLEGEKGLLRPRFDRIAKRLDSGREPRKTFREFLGDPRALQPRFLAWLRESQEPWTPVFNEWERIGKDRFMGEAAGVTSACRVKAETARIEAVLEVPASGNWQAGMLLHFEEGQNFTVGLANGRGGIHVERFRSGRWENLASRPLPSPAVEGRLRFQAFRAEEGVTLVVEEEPVGAFPLPAGSMGLALRNCAVRFRDVKWDPAARGK